MVKTYTVLRQREGLSSGKSTWRVTVRQLESLIRLSEAFAKLECMDDVTVKHVEEARRLLSKSIVRVEQPDIDLENEREEEPMNVDPSTEQEKGVHDDQENDNQPGMWEFFFKARKVAFWIFSQKIETFKKLFTIFHEIWYQSIWFSFIKLYLCLFLSLREIN